MSGPRNKPAKTISPRNLAIWQARQAGETYAAIARAHGINTARAQQIVRNWEFRIKYSGIVRFIPADLLAHRWTPESQWAEIEQERRA